MKKNLVIGALLVLLAWTQFAPLIVKASSVIGGFCADYDSGPHEECKGPATAATTRKAFESQEKAMGDCIGNSCYGFNGEFVRSQRWTNYLRYAKYNPRVQDLVHVGLGKTSDGREWVIELEDADGRRASLWLVGGDESGGQIKSVTDY